MMIRTLITDDEPLARDRIKRYLRDENDIAVIGECGNGADAVAFIKKERPDLVFLDIQMPEKTGFDVVRTLKPNELPTIIFVTAYDQYALQAFEVHAIDYLLKPFTRDRIKRAVERARQHVEIRRRSDVSDDRIAALIAGLRSERKYLERLMVKTNGRVVFVKTNDIDWIEASGNYLKLHVGRESHMIRETMSSVEAKLDPERFLRIHRSAVVNLDRIKELHPMFSGDHAVILHNGTELTLSRNFRDRFNELFDIGS